MSLARRLAWLGLAPLAAAAGGAPARPRTPGVLDLPVGARRNADAAYIYKNEGAQARPDARFVDCDSSLTYAFAVQGVHRLVFHLWLANNFRVQTSTDGRRWQDRLNAMRLFHRDRHDGAVAEYRIDGSAMLPASHVFLRFLDASPLDGWGAYLARIRIESDAPPNHDWRWRRRDSGKVGPLREWALFGPFPAAKPGGLLAAGLAALGRKAEGLYPGAAGGAGESWRIIHAPGGSVNLLELRPPLAPRSRCVVFAHVFIHAEKAMAGRLVLGSDDGIAVWWNGALMLRHEVLRGCRDAEESIPVRLGAGWNRLLLEISNGEGDWQFCARLTDRSGLHPLPVRLRARNPLPGVRPFPAPRTAPELFLLEAAVDPAAATAAKAGLRLPLRVVYRNAGGDAAGPVNLILENGDGKALWRWALDRVQSGLHQQWLPIPRRIWEQHLLAGGDGPFSLRLNSKRRRLDLPIPARLLGAAGAYLARSAGASRGVPATLPSDLQAIGDAARAWNAFDVPAETQRNSARQWFREALAGAWPALHAAAQNLQARPVPAAWKTVFQCAAPYDPRIDIQADAVMVYGLADTARRTLPWRRHGYRTQLMTGIAWGNYQDYLSGNFDGKPHRDDIQTDRRGRPISHGGDVYYMMPSESYTRYLCKFVKQSFGLPLDGICFEEPEFWMRAGWSPGFRRAWREYFHAPWKAPDSSYEACWRSGKLRKELYRRCLAQVCEFVKQHRPRWSCTVATHSLIHYTNIGIASPESALASLDACDTIIAQVWTDTILFPCTSEGARVVRPFPMAYLEFAQMVGMIVPAGKNVAFLADPVSDDPRRPWSVYRACYQHTVAAGLQCGSVARFEVMPWPDRVFTTPHRSGDSDATAEEENCVIPAGYATALLATIDALRRMPPGHSSRWIGVGVSDSLMFERGKVRGRYRNFDELYGLTLPLILRGALPRLVQLEHLERPVRAPFPGDMRVLLLTYDGQKPPGPELHQRLAAWVRKGGILLFFSSGKDPFARIREWWNGMGANRALPRDDLFRKLALGPRPGPGWHRLAKGWVYFDPDSPAKFAEKGGGKRLWRLLCTAARKCGLPAPAARNWAFIRRGPYLAASCWRAPDGETQTEFNQAGNFLDLFSDRLDWVAKAHCAAGKSGLWLDLDQAPAEPGILASASRATGWRCSGRRAAFVSRGPAQTRAVTWVRLPRPPRRLRLSTWNGTPVPGRRQWVSAIHALKLSWANRPDGVWVDLAW